jgi:hypothetical protein
MGESVSYTATLVPHCGDNIKYFIKNWLYQGISSVVKHLVNVLMPKCKNIKRKKRKKQISRFTNSRCFHMVRDVKDD